VKGFNSTQETQEWHGTLIHQVLSMLHRKYFQNVKLRDKGIMDDNQVMPTDKDVEEFFKKANETLKSRGIHPKSRENEERILNILKTFNEKEGKTLYPKIIDTELRLQADMGNYILYGVIDAVVEGNDGIEIWDYKGMKFPVPDQDGKKNKKLERYEYQMRVYAELYKQRFGNYPSKCVLYFMNELNTPNSQNLKYEIDFSDENNIVKIKESIDDFSNTVGEIEYCKENNDWSIEKESDKETCDVCDLKWGCPAVKGKYSIEPL
jgi:putative RecB family exonuclease